jgi:outer membrane protein
VAEQDLVVRVSQAYFDVLAAQDTLAFVRAQKTAVSEQLASAKRNFEVGTSTITDTREAQARFDLVTAQEIAAENDLRSSAGAGPAGGQNARAEPKPLAAPGGVAGLRPMTSTTWVNQAIDASTHGAPVRRGAGSGPAGNRKAKAGHKPTLDLTAATRMTPQRRHITGVQTAAPTTASWAWRSTCRCLPGTPSRTASRKPCRWKTRPAADLEAARRTVAQATRAAFFRRAVRPGPGQGAGSAEASSQSALDANKLGYQVGVRINIDVLNSQSQLFQTKRDLAQARYNVLVGSLRLRQANGTLKTCRASTGC